MAEHLDNAVQSTLDTEPAAAPSPAVPRSKGVDLAAAAAARGALAAIGALAAWRERGGILAGEVPALHVPAAVEDAAAPFVEQHLVSPHHLARTAAAHRHVGHPGGGRRLADRRVHLAKHADVGGGLGRRQDVRHGDGGEGAEEGEGRGHGQRLARHHHMPKARRQRRPAATASAPGVAVAPGPTAAALLR